LGLINVATHSKEKGGEPTVLSEQKIHSMIAQLSDGEEVFIPDYGYNPYDRVCNYGYSVTCVEKGNHYEVIETGEGGIYPDTYRQLDSIDEVVAHICG